MFLKHQYAIETEKQTLGAHSVLGPVPLASLTSRLIKILRWWGQDHIPEKRSGLVDFSWREGHLIKHLEMALAYLSSIRDSFLDRGTNHFIVLAISFLHLKGEHPGSQRQHEKADRRKRGAGKVQRPQKELAFGQGIPGREIAGTGGQRPTQGSTLGLKRGSQRLGMPCLGTFWTLQSV